MLNSKLLGEKINEYRKNLGYTQAELAEKISVEWSYLNRIEAGKKNLSVTKLIALLNVFNISYKELSGENPTKKELLIREIMGNINFLNLNNYNKKFLLSILKNVNKRG